MRSRFSGVYTAIVTPFFEDTSIDEDSLRKLIQQQFESGVDGIVACGSTGEAATLSLDEYKWVLKISKEECDKAGKKSIGGVMASSTSDAVMRSQIIDDLKYDAVLLVAPPYNKPPQSGLLAHFRTVAEAVAAPVIAYNIPGRTACTIQPETLATLIEEQTIVGLKDSTGNLAMTLDLLSKVDAHSFGLLSGEDALFLPMLSIGGSGIISAAANVMPKDFVKIYSRWLHKDIEAARILQADAINRINSLYSDTNPIPVKYALWKQGVIKSAAVRLPLVPISEEAARNVDSAFEF